GGEAQRVALARALVLEPLLLLADEPTGNLDPVTGEGIHQVLREVNRDLGITAVVVTHNEALARSMPRRLRLTAGSVAPPYSFSPLAPSCRLPSSARPSNGRCSPTRLNVSARKTTAIWLLAAALLVLVLPSTSRGQGVDGGTPAAAAAPDAGIPSAAEDTGAPDAGTPEGAATPSDVPVASGSDLISELRIEGNRRVEPEVIKRALKNKVGRPFDASLTGADVQSLWSLGYFQDIQLLTQRLPAGGIVYVVRVSERPSIREWRLQGNEELNK